MQGSDKSGGRGYQAVFICVCARDHQADHATAVCTVRMTGGRVMNNNVDSNEKAWLF